MTVRRSFHPALSVFPRPKLAYGSARLLWSAYAVFLPELILVVITSDKASNIKRVKQGKQEVSLVYHSRSFNLCLTIHSQIYLVIGGKVFSWRVDIEQEGVRQHGKCFKHPEEDLISIRGRGWWVEESRSAEGVANED